MKDLPIRRLILKLAIACTVGGLLCSNLSTAQELPPPAKKPARVKILKGPVLDAALDNLAIIRWITNNPGGADERNAVIQYGTDPKNLDQTAKSPMRLNRAHRETMFRVRVPGLKPQTTYYYKVDSTERNGKSDGASPVKKFTTPRPGERIVVPPNALPQPKR